MASIERRGKRYSIRYIDEHGDVKRLKGTTDRRTTDVMAAEIEAKVARIKAGLLDRRELDFRDHGKRPIDEHVREWLGSMEARGTTAKHNGMSVVRVRRLVAIIRGASFTEIAPPRSATRADLDRYVAVLDSWTLGARLDDLRPDSIQAALGALLKAGLSKQSANHYRAGVRAFVHWRVKTGRLQYDVSATVAGYNAATDPRHDRRSISIDELRRLIRAAESGPVVMGVPGAVRALVYRLAASTGLRFAEIQSVAPESFDWRSGTLTIEAAYSKNRKQAERPSRRTYGTTYGDTSPRSSPVRASSTFPPARARRC